MQTGPHEKIGFFGTVQHFQHLWPSKCCTVPKKPIPQAESAVLSQKNLNSQFWRPMQTGPHEKIGFFGTVQHFQHLWPSKCCTVPKKRIPQAESAVLSLKNLKSQFWRPMQTGPHEKIGFFGTVQHFQHLRPSKCCTVPKNQSHKQKCRTVPKKPKKPILETCADRPSRKDWFFRDSTALSAPQAFEVLYCP